MNIYNANWLSRESFTASANQGFREAAISTLFDIPYQTKELRPHGSAN
jgi:hypothetical protein